MKKVNTRIKSFLRIAGIFFSSFFLLINTVFITSPAYADPTPENNTINNQNTDTNQNTSTSSENNNSGNQENTSQENQNNSSNQAQTDNNNGQNTASKNQASTCSSQIGMLGWIICPTTGLLAKGIDALYNLIESLLDVKPLDMNSNSPIYQVWTYMRNIANVCFIIFLLIIIYSQITGYGINNYGIKKSLPRLIITAMIVNFSYLFCAIAVDVSNIIGSSLKDFLGSIANNAIATGTIDQSKNLGFYSLFTTIAAGGIGTALAFTFPGGPLGLLLAIIPVIIGGIISVVIGLLTLGLRQALIIFLVAISPVAFVLYILPNTEKHFQKWKTTFSQMLFFYPMFSMLFGVSKLASMIFISSATTPFGLIIGTAVQVLPLFLAANLMKFSGTALSGISNRLNSIGSNTSARAIKALDLNSIQQANRQKSIENAMKRRRSMNLLPWYWSGAIAAGLATHKYHRDDETKTREDTLKQYRQEELDAKRRGARIIGRDKYGHAIYKREKYGTDKNGRPQYTEFVDPNNKVMRYTYENRVATLAALGQHTKTEDALGNMSDYLSAHNTDDYRKAHGINTKNVNPYLTQLAKNQTENFLTAKTAESSKRRNDHNANRFYSETVRKAAAIDTEGNRVDPRNYEKYVVAGAGTDAWHLDSGSLTEQQQKDRFMALELVAADAVDAYETERKANVNKLSTYMDKMVTRDALQVYKAMLKNKSMDGIIAGNNVLARRGDYDKILENLRDYMDSGNLKLNTDDANVLALNLMSMKDADPTLGRLGKHINMETWAYTTGKRHTQEITMQQYFTGSINNDQDQGYTTKINMATGLEGTKMDKIDRTAAGNIINMIDYYDSRLDPGKRQHDKIFDAIRPALVSAIATYPSGSEQIVNVAGMLTGLDRKEWKTGDIIDNVPKITKSQTAHQETVNYLKALTARDAANMKSDMLNAIKHRLIAEHYDFNPDDFSEADRPEAQKKAYQKAEQAAYKEINDIFEASTVLETLARPNSNLFDGMKSKLKDILRPRVEAERERQRKNKNNKSNKSPDSNNKKDHQS